MTMKEAEVAYKEADQENIDLRVDKQLKQAEINKLKDVLADK